MATDIKHSAVDDLYHRWWGEKTLKCDPTRNHNLVQDAYNAGYAQARADLIAELRPVAWVRRHPDGALTAEYLEHDAIEPVRKQSGAWLPLSIIPEK